MHNIRGTKTDLNDVTFVIPVRIDSDERLENLYCILDFLTGYFRCQIIVVEDTGFNARRVFQSSTATWQSYQVAFRNDEYFHRTAAINWGLKRVNTELFAIYDADCIFEPRSIIDAVTQLRINTRVCLSYPYAGNFVDIERSYIKDHVIVKRESFTMDSKGGAVFGRLSYYKRCGLDNEYLISHCPDDVERYDRVMMCGYYISRVDGECYHINHSRGINSGPNPFTEANNKVYSEVKSYMNPERTGTDPKPSIWNYIAEFQWMKDVKN